MAWIASRKIRVYCLKKQWNPTCTFIELFHIHMQTIRPKFSEDNNVYQQGSIICVTGIFGCVKDTDSKYVSYRPMDLIVKWSRLVVSDSCDPMDCSLPGSSVHGIFQARTLEWVAISFSRGSSQPRDWTRVSHIVGRCFTIWGTREAHP